MATGLGFLACTGTISGRDDHPGASTPGEPGSPGKTPGTPGMTPPGTGPVTNPGGGPSLPPLGGNPSEPDRSSAACKNVNPGPSPVRRLTRREYDNTIRDLLGEDLGLARDFPPEERQAGFDNNAELRSVSDLLAERYVSAAEQIAKSVVAKLGTLAPACDPAKDGETTCLDKLLDSFGKRLWRRPLDAAEKADLKKVYTAGKLTTYAEGVDAVVQVMVLSPQFLYRVEKGVPVPGASYSRLDHYEMASRLSYLILGTMPDDQLFAAAAAGKLGTRDEIATQAKRLIDDPRATTMVSGFAEQWLGLTDIKDADKDTAVYTKFDDTWLDLFRQESQAFVENVWKGDAKLNTLLTAPYTMMNQKLAEVYGVKGVTGDAWKQVNLDTTQRLGVLTQASLMTVNAGPDQSSPILRGVFVREHIMCQDLPPPPPDVDAMPPMLNAKMTTKERFAAHRNNPSCDSCHRLIDNVGFGFENFDAVGQWRTMENGKPVDAKGELLSTDIDGPFNGAVDLAKKLATSKDVQACMVTHWFNFGLGREKTDLDACTMETLSAAFAKSGGSLRELLLAVTQSDAFLFKGGLQ
jgi:hypothetical protein